MMQTQDHPHYYQHLSSISESINTKQIKKQFLYIRYIHTYTCIIMYMLGHLDVWGELAGHQRSLTHPVLKAGHLGVR